MSTNLLGRFATFLLENHIDNFVELYLKRDADLGLSILKLYRETDYLELNKIAKRETENFLQLLKKDQLIDINIEWLNSINSDKTLYGHVENLTISDFILMQSARKYVLIQLLSQYTKAADELIELMKLLEEIFMFQEIYMLHNFFGTQSRVKNEIIVNQSSSDNDLKQENRCIDEIESLSHIGYCEANYTEGTIHCSEGFYKIIGADKSTHLTINFLQRQSIRDNGFEPFSGKQSQTFKEGKPNEHEFKFKGLDQKIKVLRSYDYPLRNKKDEIIGVKSFFQDITEIKETEEKKAESQIQVQKILESSPTVIWIYDIETDELIYTNWKEWELYGYKNEADFKKDFSKLLLTTTHPDDKSKIIERRKEYQNLKDDMYSTIEFRMLDAHNRIHWFNSKAIAFNRKNGKVKQVLFNTIEITELKETEEELRNREYQLIEAQKIAHVGSYDYNNEKDTVEFSRELGRIFELGPDNKVMTSADFTRLFTADQLAKFKEDWDKINNTQITDLESEYTIEMPDKREKHIVVRRKIIRDSDNLPIRTIGTVMDITTLKQTEEQLRYREAQLLEAQQVAHAGSYDYDMKKDRAEISEELGKIFGFPSDKKEMTNAEFESLLCPEELTRYKKNLGKIYDNPITRRENEYELLMPDESKKHIFARAKIIRDTQNKPIRIIGTILDITTLKKTEEQLKFKEAQLLEAQKVANVGSFVWDLKQDKFVGTDEVYRIFSFPRHQKLTVALFKEHLDEEYINVFEDNLKKALHSKTPFEAEYKIVTSDQREKYIIARSKTIHDASGKAVKLFGSIMDITGLKNAEEDLTRKNKEVVAAYEKLEKAQNQLKQINSELEDRVEVRTEELKESKELYQTFIKQNSIGVWRFEFRDIQFIDTTLPVQEQIDLIDKHIYIAETNERLVNMFGYESGKEFTGRKMSDLISIPRNKIIDIYKKGIVSGYRLDESELEVMDLNRNIMYVQFSAIGIVDENKLIRGWGIVRNVTDRRHAMDALEASEERYRVLTESVPAIFWSANVEGEIDFLNQRWSEYTGEYAYEPKNIDWLNYIHHDDYKKSAEVWNEGIEAGIKFEMEYRLKRVDGKFRWHLTRAFPLKGDDGKTIKWIGTSTDIEEQKHFSIILENKNEELVRLNNDLDNFIFSASHDLKGPINNIDGLLAALNMELPEECKSADAIEDILEMMSGSVEKFKKNLFELIEVTKARQRGEEAVEENNLYDILKEVKSTIKGLIERNNANIIADFDDLPIIKFSKKNLQSIVYNLLSNAVKYHSKDRAPEIIISTKELKEYILLSVKDNGLGFDPDQRSKAFTKDNRFHKDVEGSGVGLFIIKRIIDNAGGKIELESEKDKGSVFKVYFKKDW